MFAASRKVAVEGVQRCADRTSNRLSPMSCGMSAITALLNVIALASHITT
jgi:hypothetical protein